MDFRVGLGYDSHRLINRSDDDKTPFLLAGISIPYDKICIAHSDGDVLIHSLCDALLGAAALKDIGTHFPDTNPEFKNVDSTILLRQVNAMILKYHWKINNIDITVVLEKPKLQPFVNDMIQNLALLLQINPTQISIKAKTNEKLDAVGREEAVVVHSIVSIINHH